MAEPGDPLNLAAAWRSMNEANLRYYSGYAKLVREYVNDVVGGFRAAGRSATGPLGATPASRRAPEPPPSRPPSPPVPPAMALEGKLGSTPSAAFVVENGLVTKVQAPLQASSFSGPDGEPVSVPLTFHPAEIELDPGAQVLVRVSATIEAALAPGAVYRGEVTVPGLPGTRVALAVRREA